MRQLFILLIAMSFLGCSPATNPPESLLVHTYVYYVNGVNGSNVTRTMWFSEFEDGGFVITGTYPKTCTAYGTWVDQNKGQTEGTVVLTTTADDCDGIAGGTSISYHYYYFYGTLTLKQ